MGMSGRDQNVYRGYSQILFSLARYALPNRFGYRSGINADQGRSHTSVVQHDGPRVQPVKDALVVFGKVTLGRCDVHFCGSRSEERRSHTLSHAFSGKPDCQAEKKYGQRYFHLCSPELRTGHKINSRYYRLLAGLNRRSEGRGHTKSPGSRRDYRPRRRVPPRCPYRPRTDRRRTGSYRGQGCTVVKPRGSRELS